MHTLNNKLRLFEALAVPLHSLMASSAITLTRSEKSGFEDFNELCCEHESFIGVN